MLMYRLLKLEKITNSYLYHAYFLHCILGEGKELAGIACLLFIGFSLFIFSLFHFMVFI